ncbi:CHASE3 domain-containing protein [Sphingopyxis sp.]|uniref:CHASE3 domain-containing protein n=1 Tax=Sphingopyxis sp. TaxID=1908224 RepID=UPI003D13A733
MTLATRWQRLRRHLFGKASLIGLLPVIVALAGSAALNISYTRSLATTRALVTHSLRVNTAINDVLSTMQDIETGQRGYLITGNEAYLAPYRTARTAIEPGTARLERLVRDNPGQGARIARARTLSQQKLAEVDATIAAMRTQGFAAARTLVASDEGKQTMDSFRTVIAAMRATESALLETRVDAMHRTEQRLFAVIILGIALALTARLAAFLLQLRARRRRRAGVR